MTKHIDFNSFRPNFIPLGAPANQTDLIRKRNLLLFEVHRLQDRRIEWTVYSILFCILSALVGVYVGDSWTAQKKVHSSNCPAGSIDSGRSCVARN